MIKKRCPWWGYIRQVLYRYPDVESFEQDAVRAATEATKCMPDGENRMKVVELVYFQKTHKLAGAAMQVPCGYATAKRWQQDYIREVAKNFKCNGFTKS